MTKEEFEKEAEEYADWFWGASQSEQRAIKQAYQQDAEFGYNKCNKKLTKAEEILRKFLDAENIDERSVAESEADKFLREVYDYCVRAIR